MKNKPPSADFDLRRLEIFYKITELKSFFKAVSLVQASVSKRIATLETMIGTKLLDRMERQVTSTKASGLFDKHALPLLEMKKNICPELDDFPGKKGGQIHIGAGIGCDSKW